MTATLVCSGLRKSFGDRVAGDGVEFSIAAGETYGLLGPNGAGKTTTISMVCGLLTGAAMLFGALMRSEQQAGAVGCSWDWRSPRSAARWFRSRSSLPSWSGSRT